MAAASQKKTYHKQATGLALETAQAHAAPHTLKLYGGCFCPFVQRVWIALEAKGLDYQYIEVDPYSKPAELLALSPRGLVPALRHGESFSAHESTVLMEYLEDLTDGSLDGSAAGGTGPRRLMGAPRSGAQGGAQARAHDRLWTDHVNRNVIPPFYQTLQAQEPGAQAQHARRLRDAIATLVEAAAPTGPFFGGKELGFVDAQVAPWVLRLRRVLGPYRGWPEPEPGTRWARWVEAIEGCEAVRRTTSSDALYLDSYERYAENRPGTSQLADAVNEGKGLP